jgi:hypothetical protein
VPPDRPYVHAPIGRSAQRWMCAEGRKLDIIFPFSIGFRQRSEDFLERGKEMMGGGGGGGGAAACGGGALVSAIGGGNGPVTLMCGCICGT